MAQDLSVGLSGFLNNGVAELHSTLQLTLQAADQSEFQLHLATARLELDGANYEPYLQEVDAIRLSLEHEDDLVEVRLQDAGKLLGADPAAAMDALRGARAEYGRCWRDPGSGKMARKILMTGIVANVYRDRKNVFLTLVSEAHFSRQVAARGNTAAQNLQASTVAFDSNTFHVAIQTPSEGAHISPRGMPTGLLHVVYDFGAPVNGADDATDHIQAAIDNATTSPFKTVYLPPGRFRVSQLVLKNDVALLGAGSYKTVLESDSNQPIITVGTEAFRSSIRGLQIKGDVTKTNQVGIALAGTGYYFSCFVEDIVIENCGSHGLFINEAYSSAFEKIRVSNCGGYPFLIDAPNRPNIVLRDCYASMLRASAPVGYRIKAGYQIRLENCNGIDTIPEGASWAVIGRRAGRDGDKTNEAAYVQLISCNIESWVAFGVECLSNSSVTFEGCYFAGDKTGNGTKIPIRYEVDASVYPAFFAKGTIDDRTVFADGPMSNYALGAAVHSNDLPPLMLSGQGAGVASGSALSQYYDTTTRRRELLTRADGFHKRATVTASTAFTRPGVRLIEVNHTEPATVTLPWPGWYRVGEPIIVIDAAAKAATHPITINASSGGTVNGAGSYVLNKNKQTVMLLPNDSVLDWRVVADFAPDVPLPASAPKFIATTGRGSRTLDWSTALTRQHTLTGDALFTFANAVAGQMYTLILIQDVNGGHNVNWPSSVKWPGGFAPQPTPNANAKDSFQFVYTGNLWLNVSQNYDLT